VCQAIRDEFAAWRSRRLDAVELDYPFVDGSHFKMHAGTRAEPGAGRVGHHHRR
jgi:hypothetical protein